ncbi:hypothetical protein EXX54_09770, partial [Escherichia coli]
IRHADCRQRKLADFLCTGGIIQGRIRRSRRIRHHAQMPDATLTRLIRPTHCFYTDNFSPTFLHSFI